MCCIVCCLKRVKTGGDPYLLLCLYRTSPLFAQLYQTYFFISVLNPTYNKSNDASFSEKNLFLLKNCNCGKVSTGMSEEM